VVAQAARVSAPVADSLLILLIYLSLNETEIVKGQYTDRQTDSHSLSLYITTR